MGPEEERRVGLEPNAVVRFAAVSQRRCALVDRRVGKIVAPERQLVHYKATFVVERNV